MSKLVKTRNFANLKCWAFGPVLRSFGGLNLTSLYRPILKLKSPNFPAKISAGLLCHFPVFFSLLDFWKASKNEWESSAIQPSKPTTRPVFSSSDKNWWYIDTSSSPSRNAFCSLNGIKKSDQGKKNSCRYNHTKRRLNLTPKSVVILNFGRLLVTIKIMSWGQKI